VENSNHVDRLFKHKRWWLTLTYASVMGCTLGIVGYTFERIVTSLCYRAIEEEVLSLASSIHDSVEHQLATPGKIPQDLYAKIPDLCPTYLDCQSQWKQKHRLAAPDTLGYYAHFVDLWGKPKATMGVYPDFPKFPLKFLTDSRWDYLRDRTGKNYQQLTIEVHTPEDQVWGYLQVGHDLTDAEKYLSKVRLFLIVGIMAIGFIVAIVSWYLARLAIRPLSQSYQQMQQFTADAAHELRTPLATLKVTIANARSDYQHLDPELKIWLDRIERQNVRITNLVDDLLLLSSLDRSSNHQIVETCCLTDIVLDLVEEFAILATAKSISIISHVNANSPIYIDGNCEQLYRMGTNLIDNAIKYTPTGGKVVVVLNSNINNILFQVKDTGIGISNADKERIFDRFYRVESQSSPPQRSTGLGLAIVKSIVDLHGGKLTVSSHLEKGSTFTVEFVNS
jgi:signal transduction histidine kinase